MKRKRKKEKQMRPVSLFCNAFEYNDYMNDVRIINVHRSPSFISFYYNSQQSKDYSCVHCIHNSNAEGKTTKNKKK